MAAPWAWDDGELSAWLRLQLTPGIGNASARRLLARFGSPQHIFTAPMAAWQGCINAGQSTQLAQTPPDFAQQVEATLRWLDSAPAGQARAIVTLGDPRYPPALLQIADPPLLLYAQGPQALLQHGNPLVEMTSSLAMVGSRHPSAQGADNAHQFARTLVERGWTVVSGLAAGIDGAAHTGALAAASGALLPTVAVVGTGLDVVYPRRHQDLAARIAQRGLLLSEFPLATPPLPNNFPKRNRIIAGLSCGTLVVEAALASGSLITARLASEQGREVFAIPGSIHAPQAKGCHALIRQGAKLVETVQDIFEELSSSPHSAGTARQAPLPWATPQAGAADTPADAALPALSALPPALPPAQAELLAAMGFDPVGLDALSARTGWDAAHLQAQLFELELAGLVASQPGGLFQRLGRA